MPQSQPRLQLEQERLVIVGTLSNATIVNNAFSMLPELVKTSHLEVDFAQVSQVDSAGLAWIINLIRDARAQQIPVTLTHIPDKLLHLAALSNADTLLTEQGLP
jgi:phospholipid transport system transporter-binding protein